MTLEAGPYDQATRIEISHQPEGSNHFPDASAAGRTPRVQLSWRCPRPTLAASSRVLGTIASDLFRRAGHVEGNLGAVSFARGTMSSPGGFETCYESLVGTRFQARESRWLATHVRSPGHRVLVPAKAVSSLGPAEGVDVEKLPCGALLSSPGDDPFTSDPEPMERAVLPLIGTPDEVGRDS